MKIDLKTFVPKKPVDRHVQVDEVSEFEKLLKLHGGRTRAEHKYDGFGVLLSTDKSAQLYSLNNTAWNHKCFPELHRDIAMLPRMVAVGELVGSRTHDDFSHTDEYSAVQIRPKVLYSPSVHDLARTNPLEIRLYDILSLQGKSMQELPLADRTALLERLLKKSRTVLPAKGKVTQDPEELQSDLRAAFNQGLEGFVIKDLRGTYTSGTRTKDWIKLKRQTTFDLVVLGLYQTQERVAQGWPCSNMLGGVRNTETGMLETFGKITVPSKQLAEQVYEKVKDSVAYTWSREKQYYWENTKGAVNKDLSVAYHPLLTSRGGQMLRKLPFLYVNNPLENSFVIEASCLNVSNGADTWHSCGIDTGKTYAMRQATLVRVRDDKRPGDATTTQQVLAYVE